MHQELLEYFTFCVYKCSQLNIIIFITQLAFVAIFRIFRLTCNLITTRAAGIKLRSKPDKTIGFINWRMQVQIKDTARHKYTAQIWNNKLSKMKIQTTCYHKLSWLKCYSVYMYLALYDQTANMYTLFEIGQIPTLWWGTSCRHWTPKSAIASRSKINWLNCHCMANKKILPPMPNKHSDWNHPIYISHIHAIYTTWASA